jgi:hypothetical protein
LTFIDPTPVRIPARLHEVGRSISPNQPLYLARRWTRRGSRAKRMAALTEMLMARTTKKIKNELVHIDDAGLASFVVATRTEFPFRQGVVTIVVFPACLIASIIGSSRPSRAARPIHRSRSTQVEGGKIERTQPKKRWKQCSLQLRAHACRTRRRINEFSARAQGLGRRRASCFCRGLHRGLPSRLAPP